MSTAIRLNSPLARFRERSSSADNRPQRGRAWLIGRKSGQSRFPSPPAGTARTHSVPPRVKDITLLHIEDAPARPAGVGGRGAGNHSPTVRASAHSEYLVLEVSGRWPGKAAVMEVEVEAVADVATTEDVVVVEDAAIVEVDGFELDEEACRRTRSRVGVCGLAGGELVAGRGGGFEGRCREMLGRAPSR